MKTVCFGLILIISAACVELEQVNPNQQTASSFWQTEEDLYQGVIAVYDQLQERTMYGSWLRLNPEYISDIATTFDTWEFGAFTHFTQGSVDPAIDLIWYQNYKLIGRAYEVIDRESNVGTQNSASIAGEARFLAALGYYHLITGYGENIAYVDRIQTPDDRPEKAADGQLWMLVEDLLTDAIEVLPES